mgnify:CR=1 FL=1|tara:strand:- start:36 stop:977 length:942 start_codon:yes stop_codon:yes gene_type:complete
MIKKLFLSIALLATAQLGFSQSVSISPNSGNRGQSLPVVISGQNTSFTSQGSNTNIFLRQGSYVLGQGSQTAFTNISVIDPFTIAADLHVPGNAPLGLYDMFVTAGTVTSQTNAFTVSQGTNTNITVSPGGSKPGKVTNITVTVPGGSFKTVAQIIEKVWFNNGTSILADVNNITVVNSTTFTADVTVPANTPNGVYDANVYTDAGIMYTKSAAFTVNQTFDIPELPATTFSIYPNPAKDFLVLELDMNQPASIKVRVMDITGKPVVANWDSLPFGSDITGLKLNLNKLKAGVYLVEVKANDKVIGTRKFIKE